MSSKQVLVIKTLLTDLWMHGSKLITFIFLILELERLMALSNEIKNPSK